MSNQIAIINESTVATDTELAAFIPSLQTQVTRDFNASWGIDATLTFLPKGSKLPATSWWLGIFDNSDQAGALGYHDITATGLPLGKVFAETDKQYGSSLSVTISHELLEMLADPDINLLVQDKTNLNRMYAREACDAVEDDRYGYTIHGILVSDFVLPAYFETFRTTGPFDYHNKLSGPIPHMLPGGYLAYTEGGHWTQITAQKADGQMRPRGSRYARRIKPGVSAARGVAHRAFLASDPRLIG